MNIFTGRANSANLKRWKQRLAKIEDTWGSKGKDTVWCAPTGEVADYVRGREEAKVASALTAGRGSVTVTLPDGVPGTALSVRITGIGAKAEVAAPKGGTAYRAADGTVVVTSPVIGLAGAAAPSPALKQLYDGPAGDIDLKGEHAIAGVMIHIGGDLPEGFLVHPALKTAAGMQALVEPAHKAGWFVSGELLPLIPNGKAVTASAVHVDALGPVKRVIVWEVVK